MNATAHAQTAPRTLRFKSDTIPVELQQVPAWMVWKWEHQPWKSKPWTKPPYCPKTGGHASSTDPNTWLTLGEVVSCFDDGEWDGIGIALQPPYAGIDLDNCISPQKGIADWAKAIIAKFNSYTEVSPSGTGVRIFIKGKLPGEGKKVNGKELYDTGRYLTVTGWRVPGTPSTIEDRQAEAEEFWHTLKAEQEEERDRKRREKLGDRADDLPAEEGTEGVSDRSDEEVIFAALKAANGDKFRKLFGGATVAELRELYPSEDGNGWDHSAADQALCNLLAYWCGNDPDQMDRVFRRSFLCRDKWLDRPDYREWTISKAISATPNPCKTPSASAAERSEALALVLGRDQGDYVTGVSPNQPPPPFPDGVAEAAPAPPKNRKRRGKSLTELLRQPNPEYLIDEHIPEKSLTIIYGQSGAGKSFVAFDMAMSLASGVPYLEKYQLRRSRVLYLCAEGDAGAKLRAMAWLKQRGMTDADFPQSHLCFLTCHFALLERAEALELIDTAREDLGGNPDVIFIDTLARNFGGDENSTQDMSAFISNLDIFREETGASAVPIHHTGKDVTKGERGAYALRCASDQTLFVENLGEEFSSVACIKNKEGAEWGVYKVKKNLHTLTELGLNRYGKPYTSLALSYGGIVTSEDKKDNTKKTDQDIMREVVAALELREMNKGEIADHKGIPGYRVDDVVPILRRGGVIMDNTKTKKLKLVEDVWGIRLESLMRPKHASDASEGCVRTVSDA